MAEAYEAFHKYDTGYSGPPDPEAERLIRLACNADQPPAMCDQLNAELLEHYVERGYVADSRIARAVAIHLNRKRLWLRGLMSEPMVYHPLKEVGLI